MSETADRKLRFSERSAAGVLVGSIALVVTGALCGALRVDPTVAQAATAGAGAVPAAVALVANRRSRTPEDVARIRSGQQERPIGLIVLLSAAALLIYDTIAGLVIGIMMAPQPMSLILSLITTVPVFFGAAWVAKYLGARPYLWMSVTVGVAFVVRSFIIVTVLPGLGFGDLVGFFLGLALVFYALFLAVALAGTWYSRRSKTSAIPSIPTAPTPGSAGAGPAAEPVPPGRPITPPASPRPPAGWYDDAELRGIERWWDGTGWTEHRRNRPDSP
jgi:hypothetical protein